MQGFGEWLCELYGTRRWVVANRLTDRLRAKYDRAIPWQVYRRLEAEWVEARRAARGQP